MTTGPVRGNNLLLYIGGAEIAGTKEVSFDLKRNTIDATSKDDDGAETFLMAGTGGTASASGIWKFDAAYGIEDLMDAYLAATMLVGKWSTNVSGDFYLQANMFITNITGQSNVNDVVSFTAAFQISGSITKATNV